MRNAVCLYDMTGLCVGYFEDYKSLEKFLGRDTRSIQSSITHFLSGDRAFVEDINAKKYTVYRLPKELQMDQSGYPDDLNELYSLPKNKRKFTTNELAEIFGCNRAYIDKYRVQIGLNLKREKDSEGKTVLMWEFNDYLLLKNLFKNKPIKKKTEPDVIKKSPNITDERCYDMNWWPDVEVV